MARAPVNAVFILWLRQLKLYFRSRARMIGALGQPTLFLLSLGSVPPMGGFFAKFYLFRTAMEAHSTMLNWLVVFGVLNSLVSVYYYLRVVVAMYFRDGARGFSPTDGVSMRAGLLITAVVVVLLGVFPGTFVDWAGAIGIK